VKTFDKIMWGSVEAIALFGWGSVIFLDWVPSPKSLAFIAFYALLVAARARYLLVDEKHT
jgi:hypothetical protein